MNFSRPNPIRDWRMLLVLSAIIFTAIVVWSISVFDRVANGGSIGSAAVAAPAVFSPSSLEAIQKIFADRKAEETKYENGTYRFADPSQ